ncbi:MAG: BLUF domain-containing protein [Bacteroidota bacterium]
MVYIVYVSSATHPFSDHDLDRLVRVSRRNNEAAGITGMLLHRDGHFIQTLEGPPSAVYRAYARIRRDPRHRRLIRLVDRPTSVRQFAGQAMGFCNTDKLPAVDRRALNVFLSEPSVPSAADARGGLVYKLLLDFRDSFAA